MEQCETRVEGKCVPVKLEQKDKTHFQIVNGDEDSVSYEFTAADLTKNAALLEIKKWEGYQYAILLRISAGQFVVYPIKCPQPEETLNLINLVGTAEVDNSTGHCSIDQFTKQQTLTYFRSLVTSGKWIYREGEPPLVRYSFDMRNSKKHQAAFDLAVKERRAIISKWEKEQEAKKDQGSASFDEETERRRRYNLWVVYKQCEWDVTHPPTRSSNSCGEWNWSCIRTWCGRVPQTCQVGSCRGLPEFVE